MSFDGFDSYDVESASVTKSGNTEVLEPEFGHSGELVFVVLNNLHTLIPASGGFEFFNTMLGDVKVSKDVTF